MHKKDLKFVSKEIQPDKSTNTKMVCISCIVIPVVLWLWHKYLQPLFLRFWGPLPWGNKDAVTENKDSTKDPGKDSTAKGCPFLQSQQICQMEMFQMAIRRSEQKKHLRHKSKTRKWTEGEISWFQIDYWRNKIMSFIEMPPLQL